MKNSSEDGAVSDQRFAEISDFNFVRKVFRSVPSLRTRKPINGYYMTKPYRGESYDESQYELIAGDWDHEHCGFCSVKISDGCAYWANADEVIILCATCHEHYEERIEKRRNAQPKA